MWMVFVGVLMVIDAVLTFQSFFLFVNERWVPGKGVIVRHKVISFVKLSKYSCRPQTVYITDFTLHNSLRR